MSDTKQRRVAESVFDRNQKREADINDVKTQRPQAVHVLNDKEKPVQVASTIAAPKQRGTSYDRRNTRSSDMWMILPRQFFAERKTKVQFDQDQVLLVARSTAFIFPL
jgi:hypothetical protein